MCRPQKSTFQANSLEIRKKVSFRHFNPTVRRLIVSLSPYHKAEIDADLVPFFEEPPTRDLVIRTVSRKMANGQPLIQGDMVLAGQETRDKHPMAREYPVHFCKTYYPTAFHPPPEREFRHHENAARILDLAPPIGFSRNTFRSCFIPGKPLSILSPLGVEPIERNISIARNCETTFLIGLWQLLESVFEETQLLHQAGIAHGDLFLHNVIVSLSPIKVFLIDFEQCVEMDSLPKGKTWEEICAADEEEILKQAIFVQCALGEQRGALAKRSSERLTGLFGSLADKFGKAMKLAATSQTPGR